MAGFNQGVAKRPQSATLAEIFFGRGAEFARETPQSLFAGQLSRRIVVLDPEGVIRRISRRITAILPRFEFITTHSERAEVMNEDSMQSALLHLTADDEQAATRIVERYYTRLLQVARRKMDALPNQVADDEGAVISAFRSFFSGVENDQFGELEGDDDLWRILATITARKAIKQVRRHWKVRGERTRVDRLTDVARTLDKEPTPAEVAAFMDECEHRLRQLDDDTLHRIALLRLEGHDTHEIAEKLGVHQRTIQRKMALIQSRWFAEDGV